MRMEHEDEVITPWAEVVTKTLMTELTPLLREAQRECKVEAFKQAFAM